MVAMPRQGGDEASVKVFGKSLPRLETSQSTPPFFPALFSTAPHFERELPKIAQNARIAFCGNGFIHLNIAEIHEGDIRGQKTCAYFANQGSKWGILLGRGLRAV